MRLIHYYEGHVILRPKIYDQFNFGKPNGLWVSVEDDQFPENNLNWKEWCNDAEYCIENLQSEHEVILKPSANILYLKSAYDIFEFSKEFKKPSRLEDYESDTYHIWWFKVAEKYPGIIIAPFQRYCAIDIRCAWYYGWDCSSGCIWDLNAIESFELLPKECEVK
jgi:hypothetical protein